MERSGQKTRRAAGRRRPAACREKRGLLLGLFQPIAGRTVPQEGWNVQIFGVEGSRLKVTPGG